MRIAFVYTHHRRALNGYYARAAVRLGHEVVTVGPWDPQPWGCHGRHPHKELPDRTPRHYDYTELALPWQPDIVWLLEGGEDIRVLNVPPRIQLVHQSLEGANMDWSRGVTPHRYVNFTCNGFSPPDVKWLPYGFDPEDCGTLGPALRPIAMREYDCAQVGSPRPSRVRLWQTLAAQANDLNCVFLPSLWGPAHFALYQNARTTFCNQTIDFLCPRVFDALGMGCVLITDRVPAISALFEDGVHYLGYDTVRQPDGEGVPSAEWLIEQARRTRLDPAWAQGIATAGHREAVSRHTYAHRVNQVLDAL